MSRTHSRSLRCLASALALSLPLAACGGGAKKPSGGTDQPREPGQPVGLTLPAAQKAELDALEAELSATAGMTAQQFADRYRVPFAGTLGYDPATAVNLNAIQASALALDADELAAVKQRGFMLSQRKRYPTFTYGYESIYAQDLPVFVSADSILYAVHKSYDMILLSVERASLLPELTAMLAGMRARLAAGGGAGVGEEARRDADLYLAVAANLLADGAVQAPVAGASAAQVNALVAKAEAAQGTAELPLFGVTRIIDFSQFTPRGHYTALPELTRYFKAMMWLGRIELPIITSEAGAGGVTQTFHRRVLEAALVLGDLMDAPALARWQRIDSALRAFVGEPDSMSPADLGALRTDLGITDLSGVAALSDARLAQAIIDGGYGQQRIASQVILSPPHGGALPLSAAFLLLGQRYVVDSHVFSNLVYDRVNKGTPLRMMPDPLDVAFAALRNDQAGALLAPQLDRYRYAPELHGMRYLVDAHGDAFWSANLYNLWLSALRALSPAATEIAGARAAGLPAVAATEAWGRRLLGTQLASWAELRHDTILYAKQSYSGGTTCEFPDAYVEPNPTFFQRIGALATSGGALVAALELTAEPDLRDALAAYFANLADVAGILQAMAARQRSGAPHDPAHIDFINRAVRFQPGCGSPSGATGWYADLFFGAPDLSFDPTVADVHTQPTDEAGGDVGRVLHVGTGHPRLMVVTVDTCSGPRAYAGVASAYFEQITEHYDRLDDQRWAKQLVDAPPADVPWMSDLVVR